MKIAGPKLFVSILAGRPKKPLTMVRYFPGMDKKMSDWSLIWDIDGGPPAPYKLKVASLLSSIGCSKF